MISYFTWDIGLPKPSFRQEETYGMNLILAIKEARTQTKTWRSSRRCWGRSFTRTGRRWRGGSQGAGGRRHWQRRRRLRSRMEAIRVPAAVKVLREVGHYRTILLLVLLKSLEGIGGRRSNFWVGKMKQEMESQKQSVSCMILSCKANLNKDTSH